MELSDESFRAIVAHLAHLYAAYGEVLGDAELIEPNGTYFPDAFALEPAAIDGLMRRMMTYAPLSADVDASLAFVEDEGANGGGGCGSGACSPGDTKMIARGGAVETDTGYQILLHVGDVGDPNLLTASLARSLGRVVLFEADESVDPRNADAMSELTAVACGFGLILLRGACVYKKGCGGMRRHQGTSLGPDELALALALFVRVKDKSPRAVRAHLEVTQREAFDAALAWVDGQPTLVGKLKEAPETLEDGIFTLEEKKGFFSRLLSGRPKSEALSEMPVRRTERTEEEKRRLAEAKALVEEALGE